MPIQQMYYGFLMFVIIAYSLIFIALPLTIWLTISRRVAEQRNASLKTGSPGHFLPSLVRWYLVFSLVPLPTLVLLYRGEHFALELIPLWMMSVGIAVNIAILAVQEYRNITTQSFARIATH